VAPAMALVRERMYELGGVEAPAPRARFVADLEARLANLIESSVDGNLLPEVELAPSPATSRRTSPVAVAVIACCLAVLVAFTTTSGVGGSRAIRVAGGSDRHDDGGESAGDKPAAAGVAASGLPAAIVEQHPAVGATPAPVGREQLGAEEPASPTTERPNAADTEREHAPAPSPSAARDTAPMALRAAGTAARVRLDWERYAGEDFAAYLVLRASAPDDPDHPEAYGTLMLLRIENREMVTHQDTPKVGTDPRYRVVVVNRSGAVIARSDAIAPELAVRGAEASMTLVRRAGGAR
jgi:hypothetical protein